MVSKYHARKTVYDGITFDSRAEAERYRELKGMEERDEILNLNIQVPYELIPTQHKAFKTDTTERAVRYVADFTYEKDGQLIVEDTKGMKTPEYIIKRKLMRYLKGIRIVESGVRKKARR